MNKEWLIIEGTVCLPGTIPARTMFKRDKYADLGIGVKSLYSGHKGSSIEVIFFFLAAYSTHLENELTKNLEDTGVESKTIQKSQKWIIYFSELWNCKKIPFAFLDIHYFFAYTL